MGIQRIASSISSAVLLVVLLNVPVLATQQKIMASYQTSTSTSATRYFSLFGGNAALSSEPHIAIPASGTLHSLYITTSAAVGADHTAYYTFTVRKAAGDCGSPGTLQVVIYGDTANNRSYDTTNSCAVTEGDYIDLSVTPTGSVSAVFFSIILGFTPTTANNTVMVGYSGVAQGATMPVYGMIHSDRSMSSITTESYAYTIIPMAGTISAFTASLTTAPGGAGKSRTATLRINGADQANPITWTNTDSGFRSNAESISVNAGDLVDVAWSVTGSSLATSDCSMGVVFRPTTSGQFVIPFSGATGQTSASATKYTHLSTGGTSTVAGTESSTYQIGWDDFQITGVYAWLDAAPDNGAGAQSYAFQLNKDGSAVVGSEFDFTISEANQSGNNTTDVALTLAQWSKYDTKIVPSGTPALARPVVSYIGYIADVAPVVLNAPTLSTPLDTAAGVSASTNLVIIDTNISPTETGIIFRIKPAAGAYSYSAQQAADTTTISAATVLGGALVDGTTYFWSAKAVGDGGATTTDSAYATDFSFSVITALNPVTLDTPANLAPGVALNTTLDWTDTNSGNASSSYVCIGTTNDSPPIHCTSVAGGTWSVLASTALGGALSNSTTYYWSVKAVGDGVTYGDSTYVANRSFTTTSPAGCVGCTSPMMMGLGIARLEDKKLK